jgi:PP-loop superfamily ATP-utilizing enzyme
MDLIAGHLNALGFLYVCMELAGYRTGSMNAAMGKSTASNGGEKRD